ncbi:DUF7529 family protein [Halocalculus aciditolerans]|uniref:Uncharacterized protein n=1 Tax=Halocalculus aciditolerans TaxID=1383812 RepID=A0A830FF46_9EURY|nr:hypothetical protein [Halocalculus aciditolerans]GGL47133.1 hypothetical protein GCM10009039_01760 [Halocalculus aciditolerans]
MTEEADGVPSGVNAPNPAAWRDVVADMDATADAYEDADWGVVKCHPGDVAVLTEGDRTGLDVVLPDDEYETVESLFEDGVAFTEYEVLQAVEADTVYVVVVMEDPEREQALLYPAYYGVPDAEKLLDTADADGLHVYLRRLDDDYVELVHERPEFFEPDE